MYTCKWSHLCADAGALRARWSQGCTCCAVQPCLGVGDGVGCTLRAARPRQARRSGRAFGHIVQVWRSGSALGAVFRHSGFHPPRRGACRVDARRLSAAFGRGGSGNASRRGLWACRLPSVHPSIRPSIHPSTCLWVGMRRRSARQQQPAQQARGTWRGRREERLGPLGGYATDGDRRGWATRGRGWSRAFLSKRAVGSAQVGEGSHRVIQDTHMRAFLS